MKRRLLIFFALVILVGLGLWWVRNRPFSKIAALSLTHTVKEEPHAANSAAPESGTEYQQIDAGILRTLKSDKVDTALGQAIGGLNDPRYKKEDVERALLPLLNHPNAHIRARACQTLAEQGSNLWQPTALAIVKDSIAGKSLEPFALETALDALVRYRTPLSKDMIVGLSQRFSDSKQSSLRDQLVSYTYDELLPWWEDPIRRHQNADFSYLATFHRASPDIIAQLHAQLPHATLPPNHFRAEFKLYLVGENPGFFPEIIKMAEIHLGRRKQPPVTDYRGEIRWDTSREAWKYVLYSNEPAALDLMRSVATELSADQNRNVMHYQNALGALFYLHRDYAFVDKLLMSRLLAGIENFKKTRRDLVSVYEYQIMAARGNPAFAPLVRENFPDIYRYYFVCSRDLPIERWIDLPGTTNPETRVAIKGEQ